MGKGDLNIWRGQGSRLESTLGARHVQTRENLQLRESRWEAETGSAAGSTEAGAAKEATGNGVPWAFGGQDGPRDGGTQTPPWFRIELAGDSGHGLC